jgi:hypothetical protein
MEIQEDERSYRKIQGDMEIQENTRKFGMRHPG